MADNKSTVRAGASGDLWWMGVFAGILTMLFGVAALFWPGLTGFVLAGPHVSNVCISI